MKIDRNNEKAEFACRVCLKRFKSYNPSAIDCAWRGLDGEYCEELAEAIEEETEAQE